MATPTPVQLEQTCGTQPSWVCRRTLEWTGSETWAHIVDWLVAKPLTIALIVAVAAVVNRVLRRIIQRAVDRVTVSSEATWGASTSVLMSHTWSERREARAHTLGTVARSAVSIVVWVTALFAVFGALDINLGPLIAGAGVAGIALGFGAQSLVKDVVSGVFMLAEDQYGVGDFVDLGEASGTVERVSIRSTKLRDVYGVVWYVPNGQVARVANQTQEWARALLDVTVGYDAEVDRAEQVLGETAAAVVAEPRWASTVLAPPEVWGIEDFGTDGIVVRLVIKTRPAAQFDLMRELRGRIKAAFDEAGVPLAFEQAMRVRVRELAPSAPEPPADPDAGADVDPEHG